MRVDRLSAPGAFVDHQEGALLIIGDQAPIHRDPAALVVPLHDDIHRTWFLARLEITPTRT